MIAHNPASDRQRLYGNTFQRSGDRRQSWAILRFSDSSDPAIVRDHIETRLKHSTRKTLKKTSFPFQKCRFWPSLSQNFWICLVPGLRLNPLVKRLHCVCVLWCTEMFANGFSLQVSRHFLARCHFIAVGRQVSSETQNSKQETESLLDWTINVTGWLSSLVSFRSPTTTSINWINVASFPSILLRPAAPCLVTKHFVFKMADGEACVYQDKGNYPLPKQQPRHRPCRPNEPKSWQGTRLESTCNNEKWKFPICRNNHWNW